MMRYVIAIGILLSAPSLFAAGFGLYEGSSRGNALGGLTAQADDASAVFYNPAGMTQLEGSHLMVGVTLIKPQGDLSLTNSVYDGSVGEGQYADNVFTPPHVYYTRQLSENLFVGAGLYTRFGLASEFDDPETWYGRYSNTNTVIESVSVSAHVAYKMNDKVSVSAGLVYNFLDAEINQVIDANQFFLQPNNDPTTTAFDGAQNLVGDSDDIGFNLALHYTPNDQTSVGIMYNSEVEHVVDGIARFTRPQAAVPGTFFVDSNAVTDPITLPAMLFLGISHRFNDKFSAGFSAVQTQWSSIEELVFNYETPIVFIPALNLGVDRVVRELNWDDAWRFAVGFEHTLSDKLDVMWGFTLDETPVPDETISYLLPTNNRRVLNLGFAYDLGTWEFSASYNLLSMEDRTIAGGPVRQLEEGVLDSEVTDVIAHLLGLTFSRRF